LEVAQVAEITHQLPAVRHAHVVVGVVDKLSICSIMRCCSPRTKLQLLVQGHVIQMDTPLHSAQLQQSEGVQVKQMVGPAVVQIEAE
jgi:hypothetical protein